jgi:AraC-like DNA-binding protein
MALISFERTAFRDPKLAKVANYFYCHISDPGPVPLVTAARIAHLCPNYFSTYFRDRVGVCFSTWQAAERTDHAKKLLLDGYAQIRAAAEAAGYTDPCTFARAFKHYQGITARQLVALLRAHPEVRPALQLSPSPEVVLQLTLLEAGSLASISSVAQLLLRLQPK